MDHHIDRRSTFLAHNTSLAVRRESFSLHRNVATRIEQQIKKPDGLGKRSLGCVSGLREIRPFDWILSSCRSEVVTHHKTGPITVYREGLNLCVKEVKCYFGYVVE